MEENKVVRFWEIEKELSEILLLKKSQLEFTHQVLSAQMPKVQELFLHFAELGTELGFNVNSLDAKKFCDQIISNGLFQANESLRNDMEAEKDNDAWQKELPES